MSKIIIIGGGAAGMMAAIAAADQGHRVTLLEKNEKPLQAGTVLTVHGYGKFVLRELSEPTRKGRIRLRADRYV